MVLSDNELRDVLGKLAIETTNPNFPFIADKQIQPCSIDLRLSDIAWVPKGWRSLDLSDATPLGPRVANAFRQVRLAHPNGFLLQPGMSLLARTYEKFSIPRDLVGTLAGRSSLARLGLSVCSAANHINPGWRGHMPLLITNHSPFGIRLQPYLGIVQLCLMRTTSVPSRLYGGEGVGSKYIDDDGGPSRYWQDHTIKVLLENPNAVKAAPDVAGQLKVFADQLDEPTSGRFARHLERYGVISDVQVFLGDFISRERRRSNTLILVSLLAVVLTGVVVSWLPAMLGQGWVIGVLAGALIVVTVGALLWQVVLQRNSTISSAELTRMMKALKD